MRRVLMGVACLLALIVSVQFLGTAIPSFSEITLADILQTPLSVQRINGSDNEMNQISTGTILMYQTNEGRYGVLEVASYARDLTLNWRTYNADGSIYRSGNGLVVRGTWYCDLDRGVEGESSADFQWRMVSSVERYLEPSNGAQFTDLSLLKILPTSPGGVFAPQPTDRLAYSILPPRSIKVVIPKVTLTFDLRTGLPWNEREWTQWAVHLPEPGSSHLRGMTLRCSCKVPSLRNWQFKPLTYWPHATQYLISDPTQGVWQNFALCIDVPNLTWGTAAGYNVSIVPSAVFASYGKGSGVPVPSDQKIAIVPSPSLETGPVNARGGAIASPYVAYITFHQVTLEWFRWSGEDRLRAGNVVLIPHLGSSWHATNPNAIYIGAGRFLVDLVAETVTYVNWKSDGTYTLHPTLLTVTIDDGGADFIPYDPDLWW